MREWEWEAVEREIRLLGFVTCKVIGFQIGRAEYEKTLLII